MEFGISKCAHVTMKAGKFVAVGGMELLPGEVIPELESGKGYKYLGILEANGIMHTEMKDKTQKEYCRRVRQLISSKVNNGNTFGAINSRAVSLVRYSVGILKWTKDELKVIDRMTRKIMNMNRMYHPQSDTDRLYIFFLSGFSFTDTDDSQDSRGREGTFFCFTLPPPTAHNYSGIYLELSM